MKKNYVINGEVPCASTAGMLQTEQFLSDNYELRQNVLNGKVEFREKPSDEQQTAVAEGNDSHLPGWRPLTKKAQNSMVLRALREGLGETANPKAEIELLVCSDDVPLFNPIQDFLEHLPQWDGQNHVAKLFARLPGLTTEQSGFLAIWIRAAVAHWLQMDTLHGNECVPVLIGAQGCGKTTYLKRLLPEHLRQYFLDHLNLSNKFDKEMALTNNLLVCLDELEAIRPSQHAALKQTLSKSKVNGRPIYGSAQEDRPRYASFVASTNNQHPLTDATGSRRYICVTIPEGMYIDNTGDIDYEQLYAQVLCEIRMKKIPYWFTNDEVGRLQQLNMGYMEQKDMAEMVKGCFRRPMDGETAQSMETAQMLKIIMKQYPSVKIDHRTKSLLGMAMSELGYEHTAPKNVKHYKVIPLPSDCRQLAG